METNERLYNQFHIKLSEFEELSRQVGYSNSRVNSDWSTKADEEEYNTLRVRQLMMFNELLEMLPKQ